MAQAVSRQEGGNGWSFRTPITGEGLRLHLRRHGLLEEAARARATAGIGGPRPQLLHGVVDSAADRSRLLDLLVSERTYRDVIAKLGISRSSLFRKLRNYQITQTVIEQHRQELAP
jgi:DNA-binding transcriptional LysR family regulator